MDATGLGRTETCTDPDARSMVAVRVIGPPTACALTTPLLETEAIAGSEDCHCGWRPETGTPPEVFPLAVNCSVEPSIRLAPGGVISTEATTSTSPPLGVEPEQAVSAVAAKSGRK